MARVHTAHGIGEIIQTETVRGRTSHLVEGAGFRAWVPATGCRTASDVNENNSTTLPYDPTPQYPATMWSSQTTIQPGDQEIDAEERLSPSDSLDFDSRTNRAYPGPDPSLFAKGAGLQVGPWTDKDWEDAENYDPTDEYRGHPDSWDHEPTEQDYADWEARHRRKGGLDELLGPPYEDGGEQGEVVDDADLPSGLRELLGPPYEEDERGRTAAGRHRIEDFRGPISPGDDAGIARNPYTGDTETGRFVGNPEGRGHWDRKDRTRFDDEGDWFSRHLPGYSSLVDAGSTRESNLGHKYATWMLSAGHDEDDSLARFRRDPVAEIHRLGHLWSTAATDESMEEYGRLIQADRMLREAAWADVRSKAQRLRRNGKITVKFRTASSINAIVEGDHGVYHTLITATGPGQTLDQYVCSCPWGSWAYRRRTFVGRTCSHGYAVYLELKSNPKNKKRDTRGRFAAVTDDFQDYINEYRGGHIDQDGADTFIGMPGNDLTDSDVAALYDYVENNHTERADRPFGDPPALPDGPLRTSPAALTPDLFRVPAPDDPYLVDVEADERATTGPDTIMSDKDWKTAAYVDALGTPYGPRIRRTADETTGEDDETNGGTAPPPEAPAAADTAAPTKEEEEAPAAAGIGFDPAMIGGIVGPIAGGVGSIADSLGAGGLGSGLASGVGSIVNGIGSGVGGFFTAAVDDDDDSEPDHEAYRQELLSLPEDVRKAWLTRTHASRRIVSTDDEVYGVPPTDAEIEHLRGLTDDAPLGHMDSHNDEVRRTIEDLREDGADASQIVASHGEGPVPGNDAVWYHLPSSGSGANPKDWSTTSEDAIDRFDHDGTHTDEDVTDLSDGSYITASREDGFGGVEDQDPELAALMAEITDGVSEGDEPNDYLFDSMGRYRRERFRQAWKDGDADDPRTEAGLPPRSKGEGDRNFAENLGGPHPEEAAERWADSRPRSAGKGSDIVRRFHASGAAEAINGPARSDDDIAAHARTFLAKTAGRVYSVAEQEELVRESHPQGARNLPTDDDLRGTHYVDSL